MIVPIMRSVITKVKTRESPPCHPISKKTISTASRRSNIQARHTAISHYELHWFHCQRNGAAQILSLQALHFVICDIQPGPEHHRCSNAKTKTSTYYASPTLYPLRHSRFPRLVDSRMFLNERPVEITLFPNTKRLHWR